MNEIVAVCPFEGQVYIFTRNGTVWVMFKDFVTGDIQFQKFSSIFPYTER